MAGFRNAIHNLNELYYDQKYYGELFDFYRLGVEFDPWFENTQDLIANRQLPQAFVIDAYDARRNQQLRVIRDGRVGAQWFDRQSTPRADIRALAARRNQNDIAQALVDFQRLDARWGNQIECQ